MILQNYITRAQGHRVIAFVALKLIQRIAIMANLSIRGLDDKALTALKARATKEDASVNTLVLRLIAQGLGHLQAKPARIRHDDLDALAGSWRKGDGAAFERATAPFGEVDAALWK